MSIAAVILSAGSSGRMGEPKALLHVHGTTFIETILRALRAASIAEIVVVLGAEHERIASALRWPFTVPAAEARTVHDHHTPEPTPDRGLRIVVNTAWETGRLSSVITAIDALESTDCTGALIWPVDHPLVTLASVRSMIEEFERSSDRIVLPVFNGRRGHPVIIPRGCFDEIRRAPADEGLRAVVRAHAGRIVEIGTEDEGVVINIDTPEEYLRHVRK